MAWRPNVNLIKGELDNSTPGKVTGWIKFLGMRSKVKLDLKGDFHEEISGTILKLSNPKPHNYNKTLGRPGSYMKRFNSIQKGHTGNIKFGFAYVYIEWFSDQNGRVVLELDRSQVDFIKPPSN